MDLGQAADPVNTLLEHSHAHVHVRLDVAVEQPHPGVVRHEPHRRRPPNPAGDPAGAGQRRSPVVGLGGSSHLTAAGPLEISSILLLILNINL